MAVHRDLPLVCPWCGKSNDSHGNVDGADEHGPGVDSVSVCAGCRRPAIFFDAGGGRLGLRKPNVKEQEDIIRDPQFWDGLDLTQRKFGSAWTAPS